MSQIMLVRLWSNVLSLASTIACWVFSDCINAMNYPHVMSFNRTKITQADLIYLCN